MWKQQRTSNSIQLIAITFVTTAIFWNMALGLSDKRLCADENCKRVISTGKSKQGYPAGQKGMVSFKANTAIRIKSKSAGSDPSLWGIEVQGREGFAPKSLIREEKIFIPEGDLKFEVDVVKPGDQMAELSLETTTTQPFDIVEHKINKPIDSLSNDRVQSATPVQQENVIVETTKPPKLEEISSEDEKVKKQTPSETSAMIGTEYDDDDEGVIGDYDDEEEEEEVAEEAEVIKKKQTDSVSSIPAEEAKAKAIQLSSNTNNNDTKLLNSTNIKTESEQSVQENESANASINYTKIRQQDTSIPSNIQDATSASPSEKFDKLIEAVAHAQVMNESTKVTEIREEIQSVTDEYPDLAKKPLTESTTIPEKVRNSEETVASTVNAGGTMQIPFVNSNRAVANNIEDAKLNEKISVSDKNNETLPTATADKNIVEQQTSYQSSLPGNKLKDDLATESSTTANIVDTNVISEEKSRDGDAQNKSSSNEPTANFEIETTNIQTSAKFILNQQTDPNSQFNRETVIETQTQTVTDLTNNSSTESTIREKEGNSEDPVASMKNAEGAIASSFNDSNVGLEPHPVVPYDGKDDKSNVNIYINDTTIEATATATVNENIVEQQTSNQSRLAGNEIKDVFATENAQSASSVDINLNPEERFRDEAEKNTEISNESTKSLPYNLSVTTESQLVEDKATEKNNKNVEISSKLILNQQLESNSQLSTATSTPTETQTQHSESNASENFEIDNHHIKDTQSEQPNTQSEQPNTGSQYNPYDYDVPSNTPLPPQYDNNNHNDLLQSTGSPNYNNGQQPTIYAPVGIEPEVTTINPSHVSTPVKPLDTSTEAYRHTEDPKSMPSLTQPVSVAELDKKENRGLFATIMDTVNNILPNSKKPKSSDYDMDDQDNELNRILFSNIETTKAKREDDKLFCEKLDPNNCPHLPENTLHSSEKCECSLKTLISSEFTLETFLQAVASKVLEMSELITFLAIVASTSLFFIFGYYCFCNSSSEGALLSKLNQLESSLLASHKENAILKHNLMSTRQKLASIEDNSFGSNDMVVSLKKELEEELLEKARLQDQIVTLQKELENAADAGIELNKIVSELLSNQTGDESIISSVEELQKQLNEQQHTILEINASLAEKSRENSELQLMVAEQNARYETQLSDLQQDNDELEAEKGNLQSRLEELRTDFDRDITAALEGKNFEIKKLQNEIVELSAKVEAEHTKWQTSMAKVEALEECLKNVKKDPNVNIKQVIDVANIKAELLDAQRKYNTLKERWELELDTRKLAQNQLQSATAEIEKIKQDFNQTEKDKLEAQTRLEVLSNYFKDKENQLQKELSLKEAMWLKQQGETTTTVDRLTTMQEEIQSLKSQNDALRAEIEAQVAAHKAQTGTLENRAHETWLAARQSDRRYEEARAEATVLRRRLTVLAGGSANDVIKPTAGPVGLSDDTATAPSPIHMESPGSPMLGRMPPPPFLPPPFMGPPPPFMGMPPPPPFVPPGEMRPAPLGRIMSPPPTQRSGHIEYEDYLDYEGNNSWHRHHTYSPPPRTYRSLSPTDSRYNYGTDRDLISTYDTETDFSPPPSPRESRRRGGGGYGSDKEDSKSRHPYNSKKSTSGNKAPISSGSDKSYNSSSKKGIKPKPGGGGGGKFLV